jgi:CheY-like chemotaxis protein
MSHAMKKTVMIVEDEIDICEYYEMILSELDVNVITCGNGKEALEQIDAQENIDLIIFDMTMPVMGGVEFFRILRKEKKSSIPAIPCSIDDIAFRKLDAIEKIEITFNKLNKGNDLKDLVARVLGLSA